MIVDYDLPDVKLAMSNSENITNILNAKGIKDHVEYALNHLKELSVNVTKKHKDSLFIFGQYYPAYQYMYAIHNKIVSNIDDFCALTGFPKPVVEAYLIPDDVLATVWAMETYYLETGRMYFVGTSQFPINNDGDMIDLLEYHNRLDI